MRIDRQLQFVLSSSIDPWGIRTTSSIFAAGLWPATPFDVDEPDRGDTLFDETASLRHYTTLVGDTRPCGGGGIRKVSYRRE